MRVLLWFVFFINIIILSYLSTTNLSGPQTIPHSDKFLHFIAYFVLALHISILLFKTNNYYKAFIFLVLYSLLIEIIQYYIPFRSFDWWDMLANTIGAASGLIVGKLTHQFWIRILRIK